MNDLKDKTAIVSGGSDGIELAIARKLSLKGAYVIICARNEDKLSIAIEKIRHEGGKCEAKVLDVSATEEYSQMITDVAKKHGLDILVNNAAHVGMGLIKDVNLDEFQKNFRTNVDAPYAGTKAAMVAMSEKGGSIINVSSVNGDRAMVGMSGYGASKAAMIRLSKSLAIQFGPYNIRSNCVLPGAVETPMQNRWKKIPNAKKNLKEFMPMKKIIQPKGVAEGILFLLSDQSEFITGTELVIDGGLTARP